MADSDSKPRDKGARLDSQPPGESLPFPVLPGGTVTFLFTDIAGATQLLRRLRAQYRNLLADQRQVLRQIFQRWEGYEVDNQGDAFFFAFPRATDAVTAAVEAQRALSAHSWPEGESVKVRMGLHTGEPWLAEEGYVGIDVHRAARIAHSGHGGQVLLSETTAALTLGELPEGVSLLDLGRHRLKDMPRPEHIRQLVIDGLPQEFPPLDSLEALPAVTTLEVEPVRLPDFLEETGEEQPDPKFVGRDRELARLDSFLGKALDHHGGVAFITGGPGRGKTALMEAFTRRATMANPELLVVGGSCNAYTSVGDPYLPFRQALSLLTGEVEARWKTGALSRAQARRLWESLPLTARTLVDQGQDLVEVIVPGQRLLSRIAVSSPADAALQQALQQLIRRQRRSRERAEQKSLDEHYTRWLCSLADHKPVLLWVDDLQWADEASIDLLFHLGRHVFGERILLLGAYRQEEVALGRAGRRHPLEKVLAELKTRYGDVFIDLAHTSAREGRQFVDAYLDTEPNRFSGSFRETFFRHTAGHPLFTVELLRELQARQGVVQDEQALWREGPDLNWEVLPVRVEGVIEERIGRLDQEIQSLMSAASVEGERFTVQVLTQVLDLDEQTIIDMLVDELGVHHGLVEEEGAVDLHGRRIYHYRFRHVLFQQYLYTHLSPVQLERLHSRIGQALEGLYEDHTDEIAPQLVFHFNQARDRVRVITYAVQSGDRARRLGASQEAVQYYHQALAEISDLEDGRTPVDPNLILEGLGDVHLRNLSQHGEALANYKKLLSQASSQDVKTRVLRKMATIYSMTGELDKAQEHFQAVISSLKQDESSPEASQAHGNLAYIYIYKNQLDAAEEHARIAHRIAQGSGDDKVLADAYNALGHIATYRGNLNTAREHFEAGLAIYKRLDDLPGTAKLYNNLGEISRLLGDMAAAYSHLQEGLTIARRVGDKREEAAMLTTTGDLYLDQGRWIEAIHILEQALPVAQESEVILRIVEAQWFLGSAFRQAGQYHSAGDHLGWAERHCLESGLVRYLPQIYLELARLQAALGHPEEASAHLQQAREAAGEAPGDELSGQLLWAAGYLHDQRQEWDLAIGQYETALAALERAGSTVKAAKVGLALSGACLRRTSEGDERRARACLTKAREVFERIDAQAFLAEVEELYKEFGLQ